MYHFHAYHDDDDDFDEMDLNGIHDGDDDGVLYDLYAL